MKYLIWFNRIKEKFNYGTKEKYNAMRQFYGEDIVLREEFENISEDIIASVTKSVNRQNSLHHVLV